ncbi:Transcriptional regulator SlyA [Marinomonas spartinae]|uniref:Transcriptional regulator SlyA n=1 Tax=Marinomonas spartinae TaxID=1792290 RepID=A0A1A8T2E9_9GAMM|nr:MarR family transcriptional regulator [Marinomonas spartinae]SBS25482.1 Transcriptional regulator SlyA [Marinomonas spartinae]SBS39585.1 Transcriptional regulator SlyA [Marinomonas spartinae]
MTDKSVGNNIGFLMTDVLRLMRREYNKNSSAMTLMQAKTLLSVSRYPGIRQVTLAEHLEIQPISLARLIDQLAKTGLVERRADSADRRAYCLYVTDAAAEQLMKINQAIGEVRLKAFDGLTVLEIEQLQALLEKIHHNLQDDPSENVS